jgi:hypothetical protein
MTVKLLYTSSMDAVRFGRALGFGARQAVKTVTAAVDAATAENPTRKSADTGANAGQAAGPQARPAADSAQTVAPAATGTAASQAVHQAAHAAAQTVVQARGARQALRRGSRRFGEAAWRPFVRLGGVLWLEVTGVFFGIFALFAAGGAWRLRGEWHLNAAGHRQLLGAVAMLAFFGYFCVSSFVRARRRERRRQG